MRMGGRKQDAERRDAELMMYQGTQLDSEVSGTCATNSICQTPKTGFLMEAETERTTLMTRWQVELAECDPVQNMHDGDHVWERCQRWVFADFHVHGSVCPLHSLPFPSLLPRPLIPGHALHPTPDTLRSRTKSESLPRSVGANMARDSVFDKLMTCASLTRYGMPEI